MNIHDTSYLQQTKPKYSFLTNLGEVSEVNNKLLFQHKTLEHHNEYLQVFVFIYRQTEYLNDLVKILKFSLLTAKVIKPSIRLGKEQAIDLAIDST